MTTIPMSDAARSGANNGRNWTIRNGGLAWLTAAVVLCGCGKADYPPTTPVSGTLTYKGAAVGGATVTLVPDASTGKAATALTDAEGHFTTKTFQDDDGAVAGKYSVTVSKTTMEGALSTAEQQTLLDQGKQVPQPKVKEELPVKYKEAKKSGLTADVPQEGEATLKLDLT